MDTQSSSISDHRNTEAAEMCGTVRAEVEVGHAGCDEWTLREPCRVTPATESLDVGESSAPVTEKTFQELLPVRDDEFIVPSTSQETIKRVQDMTKERKNEHKRWRTAIDGYAQYSEWISKVSERIEDMPDVESAGSVTTTEDPEAEYFTAIDSMNEIVAQIEKARAAQSDETAESDAKLEEILRNCEERSKRVDSYGNKTNQDYQMFVCFACGRVFDDEITMRDHVNEMHLSSKDYVFKCSQCYRRFKLKHHMQRHEQTHDLSLVHVCDRCCSSFRNFESLIAHKSRVHRIDGDGHPIRSLNNKCSKCDQKFGTFIELNRHKYRCLNESRNKQAKKSSAASVTSTTSSAFSLSSRPKVDKMCRVCNRKFASRQSLIRHMGRIHPEEKLDEVKRYEVAPALDLPFACNICSKRFATKTLMLIHRKRHEGRHFACELCEKTYPLGSELRKHIKRVHEKSRAGSLVDSAAGSGDSLQGGGNSTEETAEAERTESLQQPNTKCNYDDLTDFNVL